MKTIYKSWETSRYATRGPSQSAVIGIVRDATRADAWNAAWDAVWDNGWNALRYAVQDATWSAAWSAAWDADTR